MGVCVRCRKEGKKFAAREKSGLIYSNKILHSQRAKTTNLNFQVSSTSRHREFVTRVEVARKEWGDCCDVWWGENNERRSVDDGTVV